MPLHAEEDHSQGHIVYVDGEQPATKRDTAFHFSAHIYCGKMAGWINMSIGTEV